MSYEAVQQVLDRALSDPTFRRRLLLEPDQALAEFDLTDDEAAALRNIKLEAPEAEDDAVLDPRRSKSPPPWWNPF